MKTILISGHNTGIGKTWITATLAKLFAERGQKVQVIKPVETGIAFPKNEGDVNTVLKKSNFHKNIEGHTFFTFKKPLAPVPAAEAEGVSINMEMILEKIEFLEECDFRLIDGCGGLAVPLDRDGRDQRDLALMLNVDYLILGIENKLGAMNQSRLLAHYVPTDTINSGFWLNSRKPQTEALTKSNIEVLRKSGLPIWNETYFSNI